MTIARKTFGLDQEIVLFRGAPLTTIRQQHRHGKVSTRPDPLSPKMSRAERYADVEGDEGAQGVSFPISEADFKHLCGEAAFAG